jgi:hypothetical protein
MTVAGACVQATVFGQFAAHIASLSGQSSLFTRQIGTILESMNYHDFPVSLKVRPRGVCVYLGCPPHPRTLHPTPIPTQPHEVLPTQAWCSTASHPPPTPPHPCVDGYVAFVQSRVIEYFTYQWEKHRLLVGEDSLGFLRTLSEPLQREIYVFMNQRLVTSVPFFRKCDITIILKVLEHLHTKTYMPGGVRLFVVRCGVE